jgi:alkylhydroperoxidase/carboxymuconolactone decarboxylase family protein YurZ
VGLLASGAEEDQAVDVVLTIAPIIGWARAQQAARALGTALGYEVDDGAKHRT